MYRFGVFLYATVVTGALLAMPAWAGPFLFSTVKVGGFVGALSQPAGGRALGIDTATRDGEAGTLDLAATVLNPDVIRIGTSDVSREDAKQE